MPAAQLEYLNKKIPDVCGKKGGIETLADANTLRKTFCESAVYNSIKNAQLSAMDEKKLKTGLSADHPLAKVCSALGTIIGIAALIWTLVGFKVWKLIVAFIVFCIIMYLLDSLCEKVIPPHPESRESMLKRTRMTRITAFAASTPRFNEQLYSVYYASNVDTAFKNTISELKKSVDELTAKLKNQSGDVDAQSGLANNDIPSQKAKDVGEYINQRDDAKAKISRLELQVAKLNTEVETMHKEITDWDGQPDISWVKQRGLTSIICFENTDQLNGLGVYKIRPSLAVHYNNGSFDEITNACKAAKSVIKSFTKRYPKELIDISVVNLYTGSGKMEQDTAIDWFYESADATGGARKRSSGTVRLITKQRFREFLQHLNDIMNKHSEFRNNHRDEINKKISEENSGSSMAYLRHLNACINNPEGLFSYQIVLIVPGGNAMDVNEFMEIAANLSDGFIPIFLIDGRAEYDKAWNEYIDKSNNCNIEI